MLEAGTTRKHVHTETSRCNTIKDTTREQGETDMNQRTRRSILAPVASGSALQVGNAWARTRPASAGGQGLQGPRRKDGCGARVGRAYRPPEEEKDSRRQSNRPDLKAALGPDKRPSAAGAAHRSPQRPERQNSHGLRRHDDLRRLHHQSKEGPKSGQAEVSNLVHRTSRLGDCDAFAQRPSPRPPAPVFRPGRLRSRELTTDN